MDPDETPEQRRKRNIADNRRILAEIGLGNPFKEEFKVTFKASQLKRKAEHQLYKPKKRAILEDCSNVNRGSIMGARRRSARLQGNTPDSEGLSMDFVDNEEEEDYNKPKPIEKNRPNFYGPIPGIEVGASWFTRMECSRDGVHRPTVAGIHGGQDGAYSIALSGGYDDNVDYGECFTYTGEGGRDLKGTASNPKNLRMAPQSKNQTLTRGNLALHNSVETGNPVRVIRGYKLNTVFAPEEGYRYDGLYEVKKAWYTTGLSGFMVWKFALKRLPDQDPPPWDFTVTSEEKIQKLEVDSNNDDDNEEDVEKNDDSGDENVENNVSDDFKDVRCENLEESEDKVVDTKKDEKTDDEIDNILKPDTETISNDDKINDLNDDTSGDRVNDILKPDTD
ncbi:hypothetical protein ACF0H5_008255 [Mactra antiquata]